MPQAQEMTNDRRIVAQGDQAVTVYLPDDKTACRFAAAIRDLPPVGLQDVVPAFATVGVYFDATRISSSAIMHWLEELAIPPGNFDATSTSHQTHNLPICYEYGVDFVLIQDATGLERDEIIRRHLAATYSVHAVGFLPGFPYLGDLVPELRGVPRLASPRVRVEAGSVGITGRRTGIYPQASPGGWPLIGRTPLTIVDVADGFFPIRVGDRVTFQRIDETDFAGLLGERLGLSDRRDGIALNSAG